MTENDFDRNDLRCPNGFNRPKVQADVKILMFLQTQGQFMFLIPGSSKNKKLYRIVGFLCAIALVPISYKLLTLRFSFFSNVPITCLVMDIFNFYVGFVCLAVFCLSQYYLHDSWLKLQNLVQKNENLLQIAKFAITTDKFFWKYGLMHVIYILIHGIQIYRWLSRNQVDLTLSYMGFRLVHYWASFTTLLIYQWLVFLCRRYSYLDKYMKNIFAKRAIVLHQVVKELRTVGEIYKNLTEIAQELNTLFSIHLFFLIIMSITITLHGLSYAIVMLYSLSISIQAVVYVGVFLGNILALVLSYEQLREKSRNVIKTCLFLQEEMIQGQLRKELAFLTKYIKKLKPIMSAGFFEMDFQLISGCISVVFAYLIIILQFNITFA